MANYLTIKPSITDLSPSEALELTRLIRHYRATAYIPKPRAQRKRIEKKNKLEQQLLNLSPEQLAELAKKMEEQIGEQST